MGHSLLIGMTEMGKTTLARELARSFRSRGFKNIVLDPLRDPKWPADFITSDSAEFLEVCQASRKCMLFMDEGSQSVGRYNVEMQWTATQARHWGHSAFFLCQGATQLAPVIRDNCSKVFVYCCGARNGRLLAEEFNAPDLEMCVSLLPHEYFAVTRGGACSFHSSKRSFEDAYRTHVNRINSSRSRLRDAGAQKAEEESRERNRSSSGNSSTDSASVASGDDDGED